MASGRRDRSRCQMSLRDQVDEEGRGSLGLNNMEYTVHPLAIPHHIADVVGVEARLELVKEINL